MTAAITSLAPRAPGRNSGVHPALECALGPFSVNGMRGWCHCAWYCFPLVVDQPRFQLLNTGSESLRFYQNSRQSWVWQARPISQLTHVVREQEAPSKTPGPLEDKHITSPSAEIQLPLALKHNAANTGNHTTFLSFTSCWCCSKVHIDSLNPDSHLSR